MIEFSSLTPLIGAEQVSHTKKQIANAQKIVITTHLSPDGDALGSSLALYHYLLSQGKEVKVVWFTLLLILLG